MNLVFGDAKAIAAKNSRSREGLHAGMLSAYGQARGHTCGECRHLITKVYANTYFKCSKSRVTGGAATDWRKRWAACALFQIEEATKCAE